MIISILKEISSNETRVASTPESIKLLIKSGAEIIVEKGAGNDAGYFDAEFISAVA